MLETGMTAAFPEAHFEPIALGRPLRWRYRGQVTPENDQIVTTIEITDKGLVAGLPFAVCDGSLWVDGKRIYEVTGLAVQAVR
jgi:3-hydroxymyristoyl/3-hydroxydecanoyl-(acyl carrier protein) dehydratase